MLSNSIWVILLILVLIVFSIYKFWTIALPALILASMRWQIRSRHKLKEKKVIIGHVNWSLLRGGAGIPLILLPGFGSHKYQWGNELYKLSLNYDLIIPDLPGGGMTQVESDAALTPIAQAERVKDLIEKLDIKLPCILIGASVGGLIAGLLVKKYPTLANQLILIDPAGLMGIKVTEVLEKYLYDSQHPFGYRNHTQLNNLYSLLFNNPPKIPIFIMKYLALVNRESIVVRERYASAIQPFILDGLKGVLENFPNRILLIWGRYDKLFDCSAAELLTNTSENIRVHIFDTGHLPYLEKPEATYKVIFKFLTETNSFNSSILFNSENSSNKQSAIIPGMAK